MTPHDEQPNTGPGGPDQATGPARKKRNVTEAMLAANSVNSARPRNMSEAGRKAVAANAVRHGMACKTLIFLDGENQAEFWAEVDLMIKERRVKTSYERTLVRNAVYSTWTKIRAINANALAINEARAQLIDDFADGNLKTFRDLVSRLKAEPDIVVDELSKSTHGCEFLIEQLTIVGERLDEYYSFEIGQRPHALRLGGHRPEEIFTDRIVFDFNKRYLGGISGVGGFTSEEAGNALQHDLPEGMSYTEFVRRLEPLVADLPSLEEGHRRLKAYLASEIARLTERLELVGYREERRLAAALGVAMAPVDKAAVTWHRYMADSDRTFNASLRMLMALRREQGEPEDMPDAGGTEGGSVPTSLPVADQSVQDAPQAPEAVVSTVAAAAAEEVIPAEDNPFPNRSVVPEVVNPMGSCNMPSLQPAPLTGPPAQLSPADHEAIRAQYRSLRDAVTEHLKEWTPKVPLDPGTNT